MNDIRTRTTIVIAAAAFAVAALAGCAASTDTGSTASSSASNSAKPVSAAVLATASTSLGTVVVEGTGMTVYVFDHDTKGTTTSACTGSCATTWPAVETGSATPSVTGVTGTVGTIPAADGKLQVTLNGLPLYTFAPDTAAGDTKGQGVGGIWWAVGADGAKIGTASTPNGTPSPAHKPGY